MMPDTVPHTPGSVREPAWPSLWRIFPPILLPIFLAVVDGTIVAAALPAMAGAFGEVERVSWVVASYLVASTVVAPVYGRLGDTFGRRRLLLVALVLFVAASVLCASAQGILSLTAARILQGFGGGGLMVLSQALLGENVPRRQLGRAQGILAAVIVASSTFGPVAGGVLTQFFGWPSVFLINLPLGALAMLLALRLPAHAVSSKRGRFDWPGLLLFAGFVVPLLLALEQMQRVDAATLLGTVISISVSLLCLVLLLRFEQRAAQPLFPLDMLRRPAMWRANAMAACSGALLVSEVTLLPIHLQAVDGASAAQIGLLMLPLTATVGMGSLVTGWLVTRTGRLAIFPAVGQTAAALGLLLVAFGHHQAGATLGPWGVPAMLALVAVFQGSAMPVAQVTAQALAPPAMLGAAAASVQLSRSVGSAAGVTVVVGALFAILNQDGATAAVFADMVRHGPAALAALPDAMRATTAARINTGFSVAFMAVAAIAAMNALLAWTLPLRRI
ncbi:MAG TPA: MFS transporter [Roseomonas sp.]|nr:MFS transporter [Roseomonas sp.]